MVGINRHTIQEHLEVVGNKYDLTRLVMLRTKQLIERASVKPGISEEFKPKRHMHGKVTKQDAMKVALEEIRLGLIPWQRNKFETLPEVEQVVFTER
jgi:DNA-directed RNA polymerase subunit K/omega